MLVARIITNKIKPRKGLRKLVVMNFSEALNELKAGNAVFRSGWNCKGIYIKIQFPDKNSKMTSPYIYIDTTDLNTDNPLSPKSLVPWIASNTDLMAEDWNLSSSND